MNINNIIKYNEYIGKFSDFTLIISHQLITNCNNDACSLCFTNYTCVTCSSNFTFNGNQKICLPTTILITILTTIPTTIPTTILTTIPTTILTTTIAIIPTYY